MRIMCAVDINNVLDCIRFSLQVNDKLKEIGYNDNIYFDEMLYMNMVGAEWLLRTTYNPSSNVVRSYPLGTELRSNPNEHPLISNIKIDLKKEMKAKMSTEDFQRCESQLDSH
jgi:hypothetical protein